MAETPAKLPPPACPALADLGEGFSPFDVWQGLNSAARVWEAGLPPGSTDDAAERVVAGAVLIAQRLETFPVARWKALNDGAGWTPAACAALSWCQGAALGDVMAVWNGAGFMPKPEPGADFSARLLNPALLPEAALSGYIEQAQRLVCGVALLLAARDAAPAIDLAEAHLRQFPQPLLHMLTVRGAVPAAWATQTNTQKPAPESDADKEAAARAAWLAERRILVAAAMMARGWTQAEIEETLQDAESLPVTGFAHGAASRHVQMPQGRSVVIASEDRTVLHVGRSEYRYRSGTEAPAEQPEFGPIPRSPQPGEDMMTVYVRLRNEAVEVWRPALMRRMHKNIFCVLPHQPIPKDEHWEFPIATYAECEMLLFGEETHLAAMRHAPTGWRYWGG